MSPVGLVPFCLALFVTMSSSREKFSCSLSDGVKSRMSTTRFLKPLSGRSVLSRHTVTSLSALESNSAPRENLRGSIISISAVKDSGWPLCEITLKNRVLAPVSQLPRGHRALSVNGISASAPYGRRTRWGDMVRLIDDQDVEGEPFAGLRIGGLCIDVAQQPLGTDLRQPRHAHNYAREQLEGVRV